MAEGGITGSKHHQKQRTVQEFSKRRKHHWVTILLCFFLGIFGAHRFYLKQNKIAVLILLFTGLVFALNPLVFVVHPLAFSEKYWVFMFLLFLLWVFEMFLASRGTDKANERIRAHLETVNEFS